MDESGDWYGVRCLFRHPTGPLLRRWGLGRGQHIYEERVTLWRASSFREAIEAAEREAREYADAVDSEYLELAQAYLMDDEPVEGGEVYSLCRTSRRRPKGYLNRFFDTGAERQKDVN